MTTNTTTPASNCGCCRARFIQFKLLADLTTRDSRQQAKVLAYWEGGNPNPADGVVYVYNLRTQAANDEQPPSQQAPTEWAYAARSGATGYAVLDEQNEMPGQAADTPPAYRIVELSAGEAVQIVAIDSETEADDPGAPIEPNGECVWPGLLQSITPSGGMGYCAPFSAGEAIWIMDARNPRASTLEKGSRHFAKLIGSYDPDPEGTGDERPLYAICSRESEHKFVELTENLTGNLDGETACATAAATVLAYDSNTATPTDCSDECWRWEPTDETVEVTDPLNRNWLAGERLVVAESGDKWIVVEAPAAVERFVLTEELLLRGSALAKRLRWTAIGAWEAWSCPIVVNDDFAGDGPAKPGVEGYAYRRENGDWSIIRLLRPALFVSGVTTGPLEGGGEAGVTVGHYWRGESPGATVTIQMAPSTKGCYPAGLAVVGAYDETISTPTAAKYRLVEIDRTIYTADTPCVANPFDPGNPAYAPTRRIQARQGLREVDLGGCDKAWDLDVFVQPLACPTSGTGVGEPVGLPFRLGDTIEVGPGLKAVSMGPCTTQIDTQLIVQQVDCEGAEVGDPMRLTKELRVGNGLMATTDGQCGATLELNSAAPVAVPVYLLGLDADGCLIRVPLGDCDEEEEGSGI